MSEQPQAVPASSSAGTQNTEPQAGTSATSSSQGQHSGEKYGESWWKEHGEAVFQHPRFKELTEYKQKVAPIEQLASQMGGADGLQEFYRYFGPVWNRLISMGDSANEAWSKLYPVLNEFLTGQGGQSGNPDDPLLERLNPLKQELESVKNTTSNMQKALIRERQDANFGKYVQKFEERFKAEGFPEDIKDVIGDMIVTNMSKFMPKAHDGRPMHPLDAFNEAAFNQAWDQAVMANFKKIESFYGNKFLNKSGSGAPYVPNSGTGTAAKSVGSMSFADKVNKLKGML